MKNVFKTLGAAVVVAGMVSCGQNKPTADDTQKGITYNPSPVFKLYDDPNRFADIQIIRYDVPGFDELTLKQKKLVYFLSQAALSGRDIIFDQNNKHNLRIRKTLEELYVNYEGDKSSESFKYFEVYLKRFWMSNGIHHHYAETKLVPEFSSDYLLELIQNSPSAELPLKDKDTIAFKSWLIDVLFNPDTDAKRVNKAKDVDQIKGSANNFYENVTEAEVKAYYSKIKDTTTDEPISYGLNSKMVKNQNGQIEEKVWKADGMYGESISKIIYWLEKAVEVAESPSQAEVLKALIAYYQSGDLRQWDEYNIKWVNDVKNTVDLINGFIEVYHDAKGHRATYESAVELNDMEASKRMSIIAANAQWFEDNSPILPEHKKLKVKGITYKVVNVAMEAGDLAPSTAIGINLPNAEWIREKHGSKSVSLGNITAAYNNSDAGGMLKEFSWDTAEVGRAERYGQLAAKLHTAMHEVIGHASGKLNEGVTKANLGAYGSTLEEARADLVALYYLMDQKLVDIKIMPSLEVGMTEYDNYIKNGLMVQMRRLEKGAELEEDHMRNRQLVAAWVYEKGKAENVIEKKTRDGKTYFVINDYQKLRVLFGELLKTIQSIKSRGAEKEGADLVETYGVKVDTKIHEEVLERSAKLDIAPYKGFIQPRYSVVMENDEIVDVKLDFTEPFAEQMLRYSKEYGFLPFDN